MISVAELVRYRISKEMLVRRVVETDLPTVYGRFRAIAYENVINGDVHLAMVMGDVKTDDPVLVRVHTENVTCDMFGSLIDDTGFQLHTGAREDRGGGARRGSVPAPARAQSGPGQPIAYVQPHAAKQESVNETQVWKLVTESIATMAWGRRFSTILACARSYCFRIIPPK